MSGLTKVDGNLSQEDFGASLSLLHKTMHQYMMLGRYCIYQGFWSPDNMKYRLRIPYHPLAIIPSTMGYCGFYNQDYGYMIDLNEIEINHQDMFEKVGGKIEIKPSRGLTIESHFIDIPDTVFICMNKKNSHAIELHKERIEVDDNKKSIPHGHRLTPCVRIEAFSRKMISWLNFLYEVTQYRLFQFQVYFSTIIKLPCFSDEGVSIPGLIVVNIRDGRRSGKDVRPKVYELERALFTYHEDFIAQLNTIRFEGFTRTRIGEKPFAQTAFSAGRSDHPSGFDNPSIPYLAGNAAVAIGMGKRKSHELTRKIKTQIEKHNGKLAVKTSPNAKTYWFNRDFPGDEFKRLEPIYPELR